MQKSNEKTTWKSKRNVFTTKKWLTWWWSCWFSTSPFRNPKARSSISFLKIPALATKNIKFPDALKWLQKLWIKYSVWLVYHFCCFWRLSEWLVKTVLVTSACEKNLQKFLKFAAEFMFQETLELPFLTEANTNPKIYAKSNSTTHHWSTKQKCN